MTPNKKKAAAGCGTRAASNNLASPKYSILPHLNVAIVRLALWGVLPVAVVEWLIQCGGLRHV